jgi:Ring finger domain
MNTELVECCICYETIGDKNNCVTPCGHKFCFVCLTKALTTNNTCPYCREVLVEAEEDDHSEYESEDYDEESDHENGHPPEDIVYFNEVSLKDITDNAEIMYDKMIQKGVTKTEIIQLLASYYFGDHHEYENATEIDEKIDDAFNHAFADTIRENRIKKEQMLFLQEDKPSNVNALDMIALNYA